jgi:hypothetical protein
LRQTGSTAGPVPFPSGAAYAASATVRARARPARLTRTPDRHQERRRLLPLDRSGSDRVRAERDRPETVAELMSRGAATARAGPLPRVSRVPAGLEVLQRAPPALTNALRVARFGSAGGRKRSPRPFVCPDGGPALRRSFRYGPRRAFLRVWSSPATRSVSAAMRDPPAARPVVGHRAASRPEREPPFAFGARSGSAADADGHASSEGRLLSRAMRCSM